MVGALSLGAGSSMIIEWQAPLLKFFPVEVFGAFALFDHRDAIIDGADQFAEVAADTFFFLDRIGIVRISSVYFN